MTYGLTPTGFTKRTLADLLEQVETEERSEISESLDTSSDQPMGQFNGIFMKTASELWDGLQDAYTALDPDKNADDAQDAVAKITGSYRDAADKSQVRVALNLEDNITVDVGHILSVLGNPAARFVLVGGEEVAGTVLPGSVTSSTAGTYMARYECDRTGPVQALATTLTVIVNPVSGLISASNPLDAVLGADVEKNSDFRTKREDELQGAGTSPVDAIRARLLKLDGMVDVTMLENVYDTTDGNGLPPHSVEAVCYDGSPSALTDNEIAQGMWGARAGGIRTYGNYAGDATDAQGNLRTMLFSRPTAKTVYFDIDITTKDGYPGDAVVQEAIVAFARANHNSGDDVILASFYGTIFGLGGVANITAFRAGFSASPVGTTDLTIAVREIATFDTSRITLNT
jgi:uncharacterized phage protein gp47/JayE